MREPDIPFSQMDFIRDNAALAASNPDGVCRVLTIEWLSNGGSIQASTFSRGGRGSSTATRMARSMGTIGVQRSAALADYSLNTIDKTERLKLTDKSVWTFLGQAESLFYVKLMNSDDGHAIGVVSVGGKFRIFDPNKGVWVCQSSADLVSTLQLLAMEYLGSDAMTEMEAVRLERPRWLRM